MYCVAHIIMQQCFKDLQSEHGVGPNTHAQTHTGACHKGLPNTSKLSRINGRSLPSPALQTRYNPTVGTSSQKEAASYKPRVNRAHWKGTSKEHPPLEKTISTVQFTELQSATVQLEACLFPTLDMDGQSKSKASRVFSTYRIKSSNMLVPSGTICDSDLDISRLQYLAHSSLFKGYRSQRVMLRIWNRPLNSRGFASLLFPFQCNAKPKGPRHESFVGLAWICMVFLLQLFAHNLLEHVVAHCGHAMPWRVAFCVEIQETSRRIKKHWGRSRHRMTMRGTWKEIMAEVKAGQWQGPGRIAAICSMQSCQDEIR